ncbi:MAG: hypothetical protein ACI8RD_000757 [Bacillariaceae sp.]|jgi:hypothetical protein
MKKKEEENMKRKSHDVSSTQRKGSKEAKKRCKKRENPQLKYVEKVGRQDDNISTTQIK